ncbi:uncharacterized protein LOC112158415, partial [Oryzias melastigma]|uniref:uncharacterized protein LOC112158415 n=1 Tax=Oryzias melastigma TaxID=30732 RepID=UPI000CF7EF43
MEKGNWFSGVVVQGLIMERLTHYLKQLTTEQLCQMIAGTPNTETKTQLAGLGEQLIKLTMDATIRIVSENIGCTFENPLEKEIETHQKKIKDLDEKEVGSFDKESTIYRTANVIKLSLEKLGHGKKSGKKQPPSKKRKGSVQSLIKTRDAQVGTESLVPETQDAMTQTKLKTLDQMVQTEAMDATIGIVSENIGCAFENCLEKEVKTHQKKTKALDEKDVGSFDKETTPSIIKESLEILSHVEESGKNQAQSQRRDTKVGTEFAAPKTQDAMTQTNPETLNQMVQTESMRVETCDAKTQTKSVKVLTQDVAVQAQVRTSDAEVQKDIPVVEKKNAKVQVEVETRNVEVQTKTTVAIEKRKFRNQTVEPLKFSVETQTKVQSQDVWTQTKEYKQNQMVQTHVNVSTLELAVQASIKEMVMLTNSKSKHHLSEP